MSNYLKTPHRPNGASLWLYIVRLPMIAAEKHEIHLTIFPLRTTIRLHLGHDLQVLQCVKRSPCLRLLRCVATAVTNGHRKCGQLDETLLASGIGNLLDVHVGHLELVLDCDRMEELHTVNVLVAETSGLKWMN